MAATYEIYDGETMIFSGTEREIQERFWLSQNTRVGFYVKTGSLLNKRYRVQRVDCEKTETYASGFHENTDKYLEYLVRQLSKTHNAGISIDPEKYIDQLKERGFNCKYTISYGFGEDKPYYIVEKV